MLRQIVKAPLFEEQLQSLIEGGAKAADQFIEGLETVLPRKPEIGSWRTGTNPPVWTIPMIDVERLRPPLVVYYTFDDERVYLLSIEPE